MILIYPASETAFTGSGYGTLADAVSCSVEEELNGAYLLEMDYPLNGVNVDKLVLRNIILCKPNPYDTPDAFRIVDLSKELGGMVRVRAQHVSYDMHGIPIAPYNALNITDALTGLTVYAQTAQPFTFITTRSVASSFSVTAPASCRELLGGKQGSLIDTYGGEWSFSRFTARLWLHRGQDRGVQIRYGKNMTSLAEDQEGDVYTGVYPYWKDDDGNLVTCGVVNATGAFNFTKILTMDFSDRFETQPTSAQLQSAAQTYINNSTHIAPSVSLRVSFVDLAQTEEYKHLASETIKLGDTLGIVYAELGITASAKVNKTVYDVLLDRYTAIELGKAKRTLAETIAENAEILTEDGKVNGGEIAENSIDRDALKADAIRSSNFMDAAGNYSASGTFLNLYDGIFKSKNFAIDSAGNAYFKGEVQAASGKIGALDITYYGLQFDAANGLFILTPATFTFSDKVSAIRMINLEPGIIFEVEIQRSDETTPHVLHMEDDDTYIQRFRILDSTMSTGTLEDCQLINCTGQNQQTSYSVTGSVGVMNFSPDVYAASAYGGQSQTFTYDGAAWKDEANNTVDLEDIGFETESEDPGDTIEVTVSDVYTKIITLQDLRDLGLIP